MGDQVRTADRREDAVSLLEFGEGDLDHLGPGVREIVERRVDALDHRRVGALEQRRRPAEPQTPERCRRRRRPVEQRRNDDDRIRGGAGERTDGIERLGEAEHAAERPQARRRLEADDAAKGGRSAHGSAGIGADRETT
jgi:hypothetical protein